MNGCAAQVCQSCASDADYVACFNDQNVACKTATDAINTSCGASWADTNTAKCAGKYEFDPAVQALCVGL